MGVDGEARSGASARRNEGTRGPGQCAGVWDWTYEQPRALVPVSCGLQPERRTLQQQNVLGGYRSCHSSQEYSYSNNQGSTRYWESTKKANHVNEQEPANMDVRGVVRATRENCPTQTTVIGPVYLCCNTKREQISRRDAIAVRVRTYKNWRSPESNLKKKHRQCCADAQLGISLMDRIRAPTGLQSAMGKTDPIS